MWRLNKDIGVHKYILKKFTVVFKMEWLVREAKILIVNSIIREICVLNVNPKPYINILNLDPIHNVLSKYIYLYKKIY
jgi:hypothetical protein